MNIGELVRESESKFNDTIYLQEQLYTLNSENFESTCQYILSSKYLLNRDSLSILLRCINSAFNVRPQLSSLYFEIITNLIDKIRLNFSSYDLFTDLIQNNFLRLKLYELGCITISTIHFYLKNTRNNLNLFFIFAFEIKEQDPELYFTCTCQSYKFREYLKTITPEQHSILRSKGLNQEKLAILIRTDNVIEFQSYHSLNNLNLNQKIISYYEDCLYSKMDLSLIEYAAFFGSIDVFKYLLLNNATLTAKLPKYAIIGGNYEIIHILEQNGLDFKNEKLLNVAIKYHRNELVNYIRDSLGVDYSIKSLTKSLKFYNLQIFFDILKSYEKMPDFGEGKESMMEISVKNGYADIVEAFSKLIESSEEKNKLLTVAIENRRFDAFKVIYSIFNDDDTEKPDNCKLLLSSARYSVISIFKYLMQFIDQNYFEIRDEVKNSILNYAANYGDLEFVKFVISLGPTVSQLNNRNVYGIRFFC